MLCSCWCHQASTLLAFPACLVHLSTVQLLLCWPHIDNLCCYAFSSRPGWVTWVQCFGADWLLCKLPTHVHLYVGRHGPLLCRFWYFLTIQGILGTWALLDAVSAWNLHPQLKHGLLPGFQVLFASVVLFLICLFDWGLWIFHTFLLATGRTTNEHVYRRNGPVAYLQHVPRKVSAFDQGIVKNVYNVFCAREAVRYRLPPRAQLIESAQIETVWDNKYYSCCR